MYVCLYSVLLHLLVCLCLSACLCECCSVCLNPPHVFVGEAFQGTGDSFVRSHLLWKGHVSTAPLQVHARTKDTNKTHPIARIQRRQAPPSLFNPISNNPIESHLVSSSVFQF